MTGPVRRSVVAGVLLALTAACASPGGTEIDMAALLDPESSEEPAGGAAEMPGAPAGGESAPEALAGGPEPDGGADGAPSPGTAGGPSGSGRPGPAAKPKTGPTTSGDGGTSEDGPGTPPDAPGGPVPGPDPATPSVPDAPAPDIRRIPPSTHPGVTDSTLNLGVTVLVNYDNVVSSFASKNQSVGDMRGQAQAVIDHVNANGGMGGRKVAPVFVQWDSGDGSFAAQAQRTCAALTEDNKVFAVTPQTYGMDTLVECLSKRDTVLVGGGDIGGWADQEMLDRYPRHLFMPNWLNFTRWGPWVDALAEQGFFPPGARVGLAHLDEPKYANGVRLAVEPALARHGVELTEKVAIPFPEGTAGIADLAAPVANAVLRFRSRNVDHVFFVEGVGLIAFLFMPQAESQGYRPRYGLSTGDQPSWLIANTPKEQWDGAVGAGFLPPNDVALAQDPGGNPTRELCLDIFRRAGQDATKDRFREHSALGICSNILFLKTALDRAAEISSAGLKAAVEGLGTTFRSPLNFATRFGPGRHDGAAGLRPFAYDAGCGCVRYTGPVRPVP